MAYDPADHTIEEVREHLAKHPKDTEAVIAAERARGDDARVTLISLLERDEHHAAPQGGAATPRGGEAATPQDRAGRRSGRVAGPDESQIERLGRDEAERLQQAREEAAGDGRTQVLGTTPREGEDPDRVLGPITLDRLEKDERGDLLGVAKEEEKARDDEAYAGVEVDRRNVNLARQAADDPELRQERSDITMTTTLLTVKPPEVRPNQNPGMHEVDPPPHQVRDADDGAWVFNADDPFYEEDPLATEKGTEEVEKRMRERMGRVQGRDDVKEVGPTQVEGTEVESPSEVIRVNTTLENVTIGYRTNYNFIEGRKYRVPKNVADVLKEKGYVWDS